MIMANVPRPPARGTKGAAPMSTETMNNLGADDGEELVALNFKVAAKFRIAFKTYASRSGISMKELLERSFGEYERTHPSE
jgi:hypothetical protein